MSLEKMMYDLQHIEELTVCRRRDVSGQMYCIGPANHDGRHDFVYETRRVDEGAMTKDHLLDILRTPVEGGSERDDHERADEALLEYINDDEITRAFEAMPKWYG